MSSGTRRSIASQISSASVAVAPSCRSGMALVIAARCSRSSMMGSWVGPLGSPRTMHCTHGRYEAMPIATLVGRCTASTCTSQQTPGSGGSTDGAARGA